MTKIDKMQVEINEDDLFIVEDHNSPLIDD